VIELVEIRGRVVSTGSTNDRLDQRLVSTGSTNDGDGVDERRERAG
jgi:hypothetical protein